MPNSRGRRDHSKESNHYTPSLSYTFFHSHSLCKESVVSPYQEGFFWNHPKGNSEDSILFSFGNNSDFHQWVCDTNCSIEKQTVLRFSASIECCCYTPEGRFVIVGTSDGKISICSMDLGILFSQTIVNPGSCGDSCFLCIQWLHELNNGCIVVATNNCEIITIEGIRLSLLEKSFRNEDTTTLLREREKMKLLSYDFSGYFSRITQIAIESDDSILISGIGSFCLLRVQFTDSHHSVINQLPSRFLEEGVIQFSFNSNWILVVCCNGHTFLLDSSTFFIFSFFDSFPIRAGLLLSSSISPFPSCCLLQSDQGIHLMELRFGRMRFLSTEVTTPSFLYPNCFVVSFGVDQIEVSRLEFASERQKYLSLIERSQFEEAIAFADLMHFDKELVYKKQIHLLLREWKDVKNANWLEDPAVDCTSLFELIRKTQPSLILYACETEWIPSRATMERILLFGMDDLVQMDGYEEEKMNFLLVYLKWKVFVRGLSHVESATCSLWLQFLHSSLYQIQGLLLSRGEIQLVLYLWEGFELTSKQHSLFCELNEVKIFKEQSLLQFARYFAFRQQQSLSIQQDLIHWLTQFLLPFSCSENVQYFIEWILSYCAQQTSLLPRDSNVYSTYLHNLEMVTRCVMKECTSEQSLQKLIQFHSYYSELIAVYKSTGMKLPISPQQKVPSNEELSVLLLDQMKTVEMLRQLYHSQFLPFCVSRNMNSDEVCSYYIQQELEKTTIVDTQRIQFLWEHIHSHDYQVESLKGLVSRVPPYPSSIMSMVVTCKTYTDVSIENYRFIQQQHAILVLRNRIYERRLDALLLMGNNPCYVLMDALINRYDEKTIQDLKILTEVYREISFNSALLLLGMTVMEDGENKDIVLSIVDLFLQENDYSHLNALVEYATELMNCPCPAVWRKEMELFEVLLSQLSGYNELKKRVQYARKFEKQFDFCLPADYVKDSRSFIERMVTECVQTDGHQNPFTQQHFIYHRGYSSSEKQLVAAVFCVPEELLEWLSVDNEIVSQIKGSTPILLQPFQFIPSESVLNWKAYIASFIPMLYDDLFTALFFNLQLYMQHSGEYASIQSVFDVLHSLCLSLIQHSLFFRTAIRYNQLIVIIERLFSLLKPSQWKPLPFTVYEEPGLQMDLNTLSYLLNDFIKVHIQKECLSEESIQECFSLCVNHQLELTALPFLFQFHHMQEMNWQLVRKAIHRILQAYSNDLSIVMLVLSYFTDIEVMELLDDSIHLEGKNQSNLIKIGVLYGFLKQDVSIITKFASLERASAWPIHLSSLNPLLFTESLPQLICKMALKLPLERHIKEILSFRSLLSSEASSFDSAVLKGCVLSGNHSAIVNCITIYKSILSPFALYEVLQQALSVLKGTEVRIIHLIYSEMGRLLNKKERGEVDKMVYITGYVRDHEELNGMNVFDLLKNPWETLRTYLTLFNFRDYFLLCSACGLSVEDVYVSLLRDQSNAPVVPDWSVIRDIFPNTASPSHLHELALICISLSKRYASEDHYCTTFPCSLCQDRLEASEMAMKLISSCHDEKVKNDSKEIEEQYRIALFEMHRNRLLLGENPADVFLRTESLQMHWQNSVSVAAYLAQLYSQLACCGGDVLQQHYVEYVESRLSLQKQLPERLRKREKSTFVKRDPIQQTYELDDCSPDSYSEVVQQKGSSANQIWHMFNEEGCGCFYTHSFMRLLSEVCNVSYSQLYLCTIDSLLSMNSLNEDRRINGLVYMFEGCHQMKSDSFRETLSIYLTKTKDITVPYSTRSILLQSLLLVMKHIPPDEYSGYPSLQELENEQLTDSILAGCQRFGVSIGEDAITQASNVSFILSVLNRYDMSSDLLNWLFQLCIRLGIKEDSVWLRFVERGRELKNVHFILLCWLHRVTLPLSNDLIDQVIEEGKDTELLIQILMKRTHVAGDDSILKWCDQMIGMGVDVSGLVMQIINKEKRILGLQMIIEKGNTMTVLPVIAVDGKPLSMYKMVFNDAVLKLMKDQRYADLFFSDYYEQTIQLCIVKGLLNEWIVYHIKSRQFAEAMLLIQRTAWGDSREDTDDGGLLRDYVIDVLKDDELLPFLLTLWYVCLLNYQQCLICSVPNINHRLTPKSTSCIHGYTRNLFNPNKQF